MGKVLCIGTLVLMAGCSFDPSGITAQPSGDASTSVDSTAQADAGSADALVDANLPDAGIPDATLPDALLPACATDPDYTPNPATLRWYRFVNSTRTWGTARDTCLAAGAHLVVIDDMDENAYVRSLSTSNLWIGLSDWASESNFVWVTGAPVDYTNWQGGEPNNAGTFGEDCAEMYDTGLWNDEGCNESLRFVCECDPDYLP